MIKALLTEKPALTPALGLKILFIGLVILTFSAKHSSAQALEAFEDPSGNRYYHSTAPIPDLSPSGLILSARSAMDSLHFKHQPHTLRLKRGIYKVKVFFRDSMPVQGDTLAGEMQMMFEIRRKFDRRPRIINSPPEKNSIRLEFGDFELLYFPETGGYEAFPFRKTEDAERDYWRAYTEKKVQGFIKDFLPVFRYYARQAQQDSTQEPGE